MSENYGWTPDQIGRLTFPQLVTYLGSEDQEKKGRYMSPSEVDRVIRGLKKRDAVQTR